MRGTSRKHKIRGVDSNVYVKISFGSKYATPLFTVCGFVGLDAFLECVKMSERDQLGGMIITRGNRLNRQNQ